MDKVQVLILAAGRGIRMNGNLPKPLLPLAGKPIISYLLQEVKECNFDLAPAIVVSPNSPIPSRLGDEFFYITQKEQKGTGHAVASARSALQGRGDHVLVLYSDHPFLSSRTIKALAALHQKEQATLTLVTVEVPSFEGLFGCFKNFGRIIRKNDGTIFAIREVKDANSTERAIREVNPSFFCFRASWLWENIHRLAPLNVQKEYYLTDLVEIALSQKEKVVAMPIDDPLEAIGINTKEELQLAEEHYAVHR